MVLTDTHTHLYYETDPAKRADLISRCVGNSVGRLFLPNVDADSVPMVFNLADAYPQMCYPMLGLHPCSVKAGWQAELDTIMAAAGNRKLYAVGEIGIDLYWDKTFLAEQIAAFKQQINWAKQLSLSIVIHCRDAFNEVYEVLEQEADGKLRGVFHCFTGTAAYAKKIIDLGFYLGIGGVVTYKNAGLDKVLTEIDIQNIVLETDSPYLTPTPHRGKPNESSYLVFVAQKVADIYGIDVDAVASITTRNSEIVFGI